MHERAAHCLTADIPLLLVVMAATAVFIMPAGLPSFSCHAKIFGIICLARAGATI